MAAIIYYTERSCSTSPDSVVAAVVVVPVLLTANVRDQTNCKLHPLLKLQAEDKAVTGAFTAAAQPLCFLVVEGHPVVVSVVNEDGLLASGVANSNVSREALVAVAVNTVLQAHL